VVGGCCAINAAHLLVAQCWNICLDMLSMCTVSSRVVTLLNSTRFLIATLFVVVPNLMGLVKICNLVSLEDICNRKNLVA
jgi:hypothetical protein